MKYLESVNQAQVIKNMDYLCDAEGYDDSFHKDGDLGYKNFAIISEAMVNLNNDQLQGLADLILVLSQPFVTREMVFEAVAKSYELAELMAIQYNKNVTEFTEENKSEQAA